MATAEKAIETIDTDRELLIAENQRLRQQLSGAIEMNQELHRRLGDLPLLRNYVLEVSNFHRETLVPLLNVLKTAIGSNKSEDKQFQQLVKFVDAVSQRTNHYEQQCLVAEAQQKATDERQRLEASKAK